MKLTPDAADLSQLILKYYTVKKKEKKVTPLDENELQSEDKMDTKTKYSLDYKKFESYISTPKLDVKTNSELEMDKMIEQNPYLSQIACTHDRRKEREIYDKPTKEKLDNAEYFKNQGNDAFKEKLYEKAAFFYQKALIHFDYTFPDTPQEETRYQTLQEQCHNNMAQVKLDLNQLKEALNHCDQVLKINPKNQKAHFRKAKIYFLQDKFEECQQEIYLMNQTPEVQILQLDLLNKQRQYREKSEKICSKIFQ